MGDKEHSFELLSLIFRTLYEKKGWNLLVLDVKEISTMTDYFVLVEGNVDQHVIALARSLLESLERVGEKPVHVEGIAEGDWVVLDYLHIVIHLFTPIMRERYSLEEVWREGKIVHVTEEQPWLKNAL